MTGSLIPTPKLSPHRGYFSVFCKDHLYSGINLDKVTITQSLLENITFDTCVHEGMTLSRTTIEDGYFGDVHFQTLVASGEWNRIKLQEASFTDCEFRFVDMEEMEFEGTVIFVNCKFINVNFKKCQIKDTRFTGCTFKACRFEACTFDGTYSPVRRHMNNRVEFDKCQMEENTFSNCLFRRRSEQSGVFCGVGANAYSVHFIQCEGHGNKLIGARGGGLNENSLDWAQKTSPNFVQPKMTGFDLTISKDAIPLPAAGKPHPSIAHPHRNDTNAGWLLEDSYGQGIGAGSYPPAKTESYTRTAVPAASKPKTTAELQKEEDDDDYYGLASTNGYGACFYDSMYYNTGPKKIIGRRNAFIFSTSGVRPDKEEAA